MKFVILIVMLIMAQMVQAQTTNDDLIIKAVRASVAASGMECINTTDGVKIDSKTLAGFIGVYSRNKVVVHKGQQPVVIINSISANGSIVAQVSTNPELTEVTHLNLAFSGVNKVERNVGTIINPRFETTYESVVFSNYDCR